MSLGIANNQLRVSRKFGLIKDSLLQRDGLPLAEAIDSDRWQAVFDKHEIDFGSDEGAVYTPAITLEKKGVRSLIGNLGNICYSMRLIRLHRSPFHATCSSF